MKYAPFLILFAILQFFGCQEPPIVFYEAQPEKWQPASYFEMIYRGVFLCESDSSIVHVHGNLIYKEKDFQVRIPLDEINDSEELIYENQKLFIVPLNQLVDAQLQDDSVSALVTLRDTFFQIGKNNVLKNFNGHSILNKKLSEDKWEVQILSLDPDMNLRLSIAILPEDIHELEKLTPVKDISTDENVQLLIRPSIIEFQELLNRPLIFMQCDQYTRINQPLII